VAAKPARFAPLACDHRVEVFPSHTVDEADPYGAGSAPSSIQKPVDHGSCSPTERYFTIVKLSDFGAERTPAELVAVITSV
jgi:hypothetical protein